MIHIGLLGSIVILYNCMRFYSPTRGCFEWERDHCKCNWILFWVVDQANTCKYMKYLA